MGVLFCAGPSCIVVSGIDRAWHAPICLARLTACVTSLPLPLRALLDLVVPQPHILLLLLPHLLRTQCLRPLPRYAHVFRRHRSLRFRRLRGGPCLRRSSRKGFLVLTKRHLYADLTAITPPSRRAPGDGTSERRQFAQKGSLLTSATPARDDRGLTIGSIDRLSSASTGTGRVSAIESFCAARRASLQKSEDGNSTAGSDVDFLDAQRAIQSSCTRPLSMSVNAGDDEDQEENNDEEVRQRSRVAPRPSSARFFSAPSHTPS